MTVFFVIRNHLEMVRYANKFDLEDPEVIDAFANFVEGNNAYDFFMFILSVMPMQPLQTYGMRIKKNCILNFLTTLSVLEGKRARKDPSILKDAFKNLSIEGIPQEELIQHLDLVPVRYFSHVGKEDASRHVEMVSLQTKQNSTSPEVGEMTYDEASP